MYTSRTLRRPPGRESVATESQVFTEVKPVIGTPGPRHSVDTSLADVATTSATLRFPGYSRLILCGTRCRSFAREPPSPSLPAMTLANQVSGLRHHSQRHDLDPSIPVRFETGVILPH